MIKFREGEVWLTRSGEIAKILLISDSTWWKPMTVAVPSMGPVPYRLDGVYGEDLPQHDLVTLVEGGEV